ncbi:MAG: putative Zn-dependent peptidase [Planctomycetota bacterium]|nr:putative Zn-dependent peptidase [Planctomycetota bacterium]
MNPTLRLPELPFKKMTLTNGLEVIALKTGLLPIVAVNLWYHVGSKNEERTQRGFAHLFEHLMFEGSEHYPGDYFKPLQRLGAAVNGSTSPDRTNYFVDLPSAHVEIAVAMESDRMANFLPALSDEKIRVQKDVVKNEYRQNYANRPYGQVGKALAEAMYGPDHPYSWLTIGEMEDVERASRDDIQAFFRRYYVPSNASLALVGDIEEDRAFELAERYFGPIPGGMKSQPLWWARAEGYPNSKEITLLDRVELDRIYLIWETVPQFHEHDAPLTLLADILARGRSSRLYGKLVMDEQIAQDVTAYQSGREIAGTFGVIVTLRPGVAPERAKSRVYEELEAIAADGVTALELDRVKNGRLAGFLYALDNVGGFGGVADRLNAYNTYLGDPGRITADFARYQAVTPDQIQSIATSSFATGRSWTAHVALTVLGRKTPTILPPLDRSIRPVSASASAFHAPLPEVRELACGVPLWVLPRRDLPIIAASVVMAAGASAHGPEQGGLASLTAEVLDEGTTTRSSRELALIAESLGTSLSTSCGWDGSYVGMQCLTPHLSASLDLVFDVLLQPTFPEADFARVSAQTLSGLKAERDRAESLAHRVFIQTLYPESHPYRTTVDGDEATVGRFTRADLQRFHREHYRPDRAAIVVAGDVDPDEIAATLDRYLAGWVEPGPVRNVTPPTELATRLRILLVDRPGAAQAVVRVGHVGPDRNNPDHDALMLFNQILGGQFTSRLNEKLREEKGFTYGIRSHFDARRGPGPFSISASLQADRLAEALGDIRHVVEDLLGDRPPTSDELDDARRSLVEGQARHFETPSALVSRYAGLFLYGLPRDDHARLADRLQQVSIQGMRDAAHRHVHPNAFAFVVVADAESVLRPLEGLGWCDVERIGS